VIIPGRKYSFAELAVLRNNPEYEGWQMKGYHWRYELDGSAMLVPWTDVPGTAGRPFRANRGSAGFTAPPIVKRKPIERVDAMMLRWINDMKRAGGLPTLQSGIAPRVRMDDGTTRPPTTAEKEDAARRRKLEQEQNEQRIKDIVGAAWQAGRTEITADVVRQVAARFLGMSEKDFAAAEQKKVTSTAPSD
jgi:hypothetical protein